MGSGSVSDVLASVMINANPGNVISHSASGSQHESLIQTKPLPPPQPKQPPRTTAEKKQKQKRAWSRSAEALMLVGGWP